MSERERRQATSGSVLSLGSVNADFQIRVGRRPDVSETLVGEEFKRLGGGKGANVAYFAVRLGVSARLFGRVGDDELAEQALAPLREIGVDLSDVCKMEGETTGVAMITVPPDGQKGIVLAPNANNAWTSEDGTEIAQTIAEMTPESVLVIDCEVPLAIIEKAVEAARSGGLAIILDPSPAEQVTDALITAADFIVPNASEAKQLTGIECRDADSAARAGRRLLDRGAEAACVKLPEGGCVLVERTQVTRIDAIPVDVIDSTGAGDAFAGALAVALVEGRSPVDAVRWAVAASHLTVAGYGSQAALPTREQLQEMADRLEAHTDVLSAE